MFHSTQVNARWAGLSPFHQMHLGNIRTALPRSIAASSPAPRPSQDRSPFTITSTMNSEAKGHVTVWR
jgi:hypothetical protein